MCLRNGYMYLKFVINPILYDLVLQQIHIFTKLK